MGTKRVQKSRTVQKQRWNPDIGGYESYSEVETYFDTEYFTDTSSSFSSDSAYGGSE